MAWKNNSPWPKVRFIFDGREYQWSGWFGCQLESWEWLTVPAGTQRTLRFENGDTPVTMTVFSTKRDGLMVRTTWSVPKCGTHDEYVARINGLRHALAKLI